LKGGESKGIERTEESELPQGRGESLVAELDSAVNRPNSCETNSSAGV